MSARPDGHAPLLVLASASAARAAVLDRAGVPVSIHPADIDEQTIRDTLSAGENRIEPGDIAMILAQAKATSVSEQFAGTYVIGADQILVCDAIRYDKPQSMAQARAHLIALRGRTHALISAIAIARDGEVIWSHDDTANLRMRDFSNEFLGTYLADIGNEALSSVGSYKLEGSGVQLFEAIDGDYFTILGLPLIPLLEFLRTQGMLAR